jgi:hypothetical protein
LTLSMIQQNVIKNVSYSSYSKIIALRLIEMQD